MPDSEHLEGHLTITEFTREYKTSRAQLYKLLRSAEIRAVKVGRRTLISRREARRWADSLPVYQPAAPNSAAKITSIEQAR